MQWGDKYYRIFNKPRTENREPRTENWELGTENRKP